MRCAGVDEELSSTPHELLYSNLISAKQSTFCTFTWHAVVGHLAENVDDQCSNLRSAFLFWTTRFLKVYTAVKRRLLILVRHHRRSHSPYPKSRRAQLSRQPLDTMQTDNSASDVLRNASFAQGSAGPSSSPDAPVTANDLLLGAYDPAKLHPMAGLEDKLDYLLLEDDMTSDLPGSGTAIPSRGWSDDLCYGTGTMYLSGVYLSPNFIFSFPLVPGSFVLVSPLFFVFDHLVALTRYLSCPLLLSSSHHMGSSFLFQASPLADYGVFVRVHDVPWLCQTHACGSTVSSIQSLEEAHSLETRLVS